jgi:hypothetical protein
LSILAVGHVRRASGGGDDHRDENDLHRNAGDVLQSQDYKDRQFFDKPQGPQPSSRFEA